MTYLGLIFLVAHENGFLSFSELRKNTQKPYNKQLKYLEFIDTYMNHVKYIL